MDPPHKGLRKYLPSDELEILSLKLKTSWLFYTTPDGECNVKYVRFREMARDEIDFIWSLNRG